MLLEALDRFGCEAGDAPEHVQPIRRRFKDVGRRWAGRRGPRVAARSCSPVVVGLEEDVTDGADRVLRARADAGLMALTLT